VVKAPRSHASGRRGTGIEPPSPCRRCDQPAASNAPHRSLLQMHPKAHFRVVTPAPHFRAVIPLPSTVSPLPAVAPSMRPERGLPPNGATSLFGRLRLRGTVGHRPLGTAFATPAAGSVRRSDLGSRRHPCACTKSTQTVGNTDSASRPPKRTADTTAARSIADT